MSIVSDNLKKATYVIFAENLKKARALKGWTQQSAAARVGVKRTAYQAWEEGRACPTAYFLVPLAHVFGIADILAFLSKPCSPQCTSRPEEKIVLPPTLLEQKYNEAGIREKLAVNILLGLVDLE